MKCLHGEPAAHSTTQNGSFWFCNQSPSCHFFCPEDEGYLFEKAIELWKSTKQPHPRCDGHQKLAKMRVVKTYWNLPMADPSSCVPINRILVPSGFGAMCDLSQNQNVVMDLRAWSAKSRRKVSTRIVGSSAAQTIRRTHVDFSNGFLMIRPTHIIVVWTFSSRHWENRHRKNPRNIIWQLNLLTILLIT